MRIILRTLLTRYTPTGPLRRTASPNLLYALGLIRFRLYGFSSSPGDLIFRYVRFRPTRCNTEIRWVQRRIAYTKSTGLQRPMSSQLDAIYIYIYYCRFTFAFENPVVRKPVKLLRYVLRVGSVLYSF